MLDSSRKKMVFYHPKLPRVVVKVASSPEHNEHTVGETISSMEICNVLGGKPLDGTNDIAQDIVAWTSEHFMINGSLKAEVPRSFRLAALVQERLLGSHIFRPRTCQYYYQQARHGGFWNSETATLTTARGLVYVAHRLLVQGGYIDDMQLSIERPSGRLKVVDPRSFVKAQYVPTSNLGMASIARTRGAHSSHEFEGSVSIWASRRQAAALLSMALITILSLESNGEDVIDLLLCEYAACDLGCIIEGIRAPLTPEAVLLGGSVRAQRIVMAINRLFGIPRSRGGNVSSSHGGLHGRTGANASRSCSRCYGGQLSREIESRSLSFVSSHGELPCASKGEHLISDEPALVCAGLRGKQEATFRAAHASLALVTEHVCSCACSSDPIGEALCGETPSPSKADREKRYLESNKFCVNARREWARHSPLTARALSPARRSRWTRMPLLEAHGTEEFASLHLALAFPHTMPNHNRA